MVNGTTWPSDATLQAGLITGVFDACVTHTLGGSPRRRATPSVHGTRRTGENWSG